MLQLRQVASYSVTDVTGNGEMCKILMVLMISVKSAKSWLTAPPPATPFGLLSRNHQEINQIKDYFCNVVKR